MLRFPASRPALAALVALAGCDRIPGLQQRPAAAAVLPPALSMGPWLLDPQAGRITVAWVTAQPSVGRVWYGTSQPDRLATEEGGPVTDHRVTLASLQPATQVRYRIEGADQAYVFTTAPEPTAENPIEVLVYGDNRTNNGDHALVARAAAAEHAQLALHTGDMVVNAKDPDLWRVWFHEEHDLLATTPFVPTVGNHEITDTGVAYSRWFQHRGRPEYWSLDYGPLHIDVLDSFETAPGARNSHAAGISDAQRAWFEEDLRQVPKDRHVWVLVHQGPYGHPAHPRPGHGGSDAVRAAVTAAQKIHPIEVVFAGHEHFYERGEIDGLKYFVLGGGGAPLEDPDPSFPGVLAAQKALSYATVQVCGCHTRGWARDISGKILDSFILSDCPKPCGALGAAPADVALAPLIDSRDGGSDEGRRRNRRRRSSEDAGTPGGGQADGGAPQ